MLRRTAERTREGWRAYLAGRPDYEQEVASAERGIWAPSWPLVMQAVHLPAPVVLLVVPCPKPPVFPNRASPNVASESRPSPAPTWETCSSQPLDCFGAARLGIIRASTKIEGVVMKSRGVVVNTETRWIEQAALIGAALAAFIALALGTAGWTLLSTALGVTLALILMAYVNVSVGSLRVRLLRLVTVSAVGGLDLSLTLAYPFQEWLVRPRVLTDCRKLSRLPTEVAACVGSASAPGLTVLWLIGGFAIFAIVAFGLPALATTSTGKRISRQLRDLKPTL